MKLRIILLFAIFISFLNSAYAGREVRMVPENWEHPKDENQHYIPLFDGSYYEKDLKLWDESAEKFSKGLQTDFEGGWYPLEDEYKSMSYTEYDGPRPEKADYMPNWNVDTNVLYVMYETTTEGTPISPAFKTKEKLAKWLYDNKASAFGNYTATYEEWLAMINQSSAVPSLVITKDGVTTGVGASLNEN